MCTYLPSFEDRQFLEDRRHLFVSIIAYTRPARTCLPEKVSGSQLLWSSRSDPETIGNICLLVYLSSRQVKFGPIVPPSARSAENLSIYNSFFLWILQKKRPRAQRGNFFNIQFIVLMNYWGEGLFVMIQAARSAEFHGKLSICLLV